MNNCEQFKDLILTEYIDGELDAVTKKTVDEHLLSCPTCRTFLEEVQKDLISPLNALSRQKVSADVWLSIKEKIESETMPIEEKEDIRNWLRGFFLGPRAALAVASFTLFVFLGIAVIHDVQIKQAKDKEQGEYLVSLLGQNGTSDSENNEIGTSIEKYFL